MLSPTAMTAYKDYFSIQQLSLTNFKQYNATPFYHILLLNGEGTIFIDSASFNFKGEIALFTTPYQQLKISGTSNSAIEKQSFHGDLWNKNMGLIGGLLTFIMSLVTLSFLITTPEVYVTSLGGPHHGFPYLSGAGRLVVKDVIMMAAGLLVASEAAKKIVN